MLRAFSNFNYSVFSSGHLRCHLGTGHFFLRLLEGVAKLLFGFWTERFAKDTTSFEGAHHCPKRTSNKRANNCAFRCTFKLLAFFRFSYSAYGTIAGTFRGASSNGCSERLGCSNRPSPAGGQLSSGSSCFSCSTDKAAKASSHCAAGSNIECHAACFNNARLTLGG